MTSTIRLNIDSALFFISAGLLLSVARAFVYSAYLLSVLHINTDNDSSWRLPRMQQTMSVDSVHGMAARKILSSHLHSSVSQE